MNFLKILFNSIPDNWYIGMFFVFAAAALHISNTIAHTVEKSFEPESEMKLKKENYYWLEKSYTLFITLITIFPLLGMFGTVKSLLELDMSGDMSALKNNFFQALTSTAWGIICAVFFKIINANFQPFIENQIAKAKKILDI